MTDILDFGSFLESKQLNYNENISDSDDALKYMHENGLDNIVFEQQIIISINNIDVMKRDKNGYYYFEVRLPKLTDYVDKFRLESTNKNTNMRISVDDKIIDSFTEFIICVATMSELKFVIYFKSRPSLEDEIVIKYRSYYFSSSDLDKIIDKQINTPIAKYSNDKCRPFTKFHQDQE